MVNEQRPSATPLLHPREALRTQRYRFSRIRSNSTYAAPNWGRLSRGGAASRPETSALTQVPKTTPLIGFPPAQAPGDRGELPERRRYWQPGSPASYLCPAARPAPGSAPRTVAPPARGPRPRSASCVPAAQAARRRTGAQRLLAAPASCPMPRGHPRQRVGRPRGRAGGRAPPLPLQAAAAPDPAAARAPARTTFLQPRRRPRPAPPPGRPLDPAHPWAPPLGPPLAGGW